MVIATNQRQLGCWRHEVGRVFTQAGVERWIPGTAAVRRMQDPVRAASELPHGIERGRDGDARHVLAVTLQTDRITAGGQAHRACHTLRVTTVDHRGSGAGGRCLQRPLGERLQPGDGEAFHQSLARHDVRGPRMDRRESGGAVGERRLELGL